MAPDSTNEAASVGPALQKQAEHRRLTRAQMQQRLADIDLPVEHAYGRTTSTPASSRAFTFSAGASSVTKTSVGTSAAVVTS